MMKSLVFTEELKNIMRIYNVEDIEKKKVVNDELLNKNNCEVCFSRANKKYTKCIIWDEYKFCSESCQDEGEYKIRKAFRKHCSLLNK